MKNFAPLVLVLLLLVGCTSPEENTTPVQSPDTVTDTGQASLELNRPDANNPENENMEFPTGWSWRLDRPDPGIVVGNDTSTADIWFVTMAPGWHVTMKRPRAILYHPASTAEGSYTASSKIHLFNPGRRNEAYGIFIGGQNLENEDVSYIYFLIRRSGDFIIKSRHGNDTGTLAGWTASDAIVPYTEETTGTVTNTLAVHVTDGEVQFLINDAVVYALPHDTLRQDEIQTDGVFGLRFNHGINAHIETLDVTPDVE